MGEDFAAPPLPDRRIVNAQDAPRVKGIGGAFEISYFVCVDKKGKPHPHFKCNCKQAGHGSCEKRRGRCQASRPGTASSSQLRVYTFGTLSIGRVTQRRPPITRNGRRAARPIGLRWGIGACSSTWRRSWDDSALFGPV